MDTLIELQRDYSKLFIGPFKLLAPPYGSLYLEAEDELYGDSTFDVLDYYSKYDLHIKEDTIPDHISLELEFLYVLQQKKIDYSEKEKFVLLEEVSRVQNQFMNDHLKLWIDEFANKLAANSQTHIYKLLGNSLPWLVNSI